jgi:uncharacterized protein DUF2188
VAHGLQRGALMNAPTSLQHERFAYHVVPAGKLWKVTIPGDSVPLSLFSGKEEAIARAVEHARAEGLAVIVHAPDGSVERELTSR